MSGLMPPNVLAYEGQVAVPSINRTFAPTTSFNQFNVPTLWIDTLNENAYVLVAKPTGLAQWVALGGSSGTLDTITTPDSTVVMPVAGNINFLNGMGLNITGSGDNITFNATGGGLHWTLVTGSTQAISPNNGYVANNGAGVTFSLPTSCPFGSFIGINTISAGGFTITQAAGQQIQLGKQNTTIGAGGSLSSTQIGDSLILLCTLADTNFIAISVIGDITYV